MILQSNPDLVTFKIVKTLDLVTILLLTNCRIADKSLWIKKNIILIWTQIPLLLWCLSKSHDLRRSTLKYFEGEKEFRLSVWPARVLAQHLAKSLIKLSKEIKYHISKSNTQIWIHFYNFWWFIILNLSHREKINDKNGLHYFLFFKNFKICPQN